MRQASTRFIAVAVSAPVRPAADKRLGPLLPWIDDRRAALNDWLAHKVRPMFEERVLPVTEDVMFKWRLLVEEGRKAGHTFSQPDLIIAATALCRFAPGREVSERDVERK
jgi:hypothetical protein